MFNWPGQDQQQLQNNSGDFWKGIGNWWDGIIGGVSKPINYGPVDEGIRQSVAKQGYGFSDRDQMGDLFNRQQGDYKERQAMGQPFSLPDALRPHTDSPVGTGTVLAGLNNNISPDEVSGNAALSPEDQMIADTIAAIQARLQQKYSYDGKFDKMVDQAFNPALGAIDKAEGRANSNYKQSDEFVDGLTDAHVAEINGHDRQQVRNVGAEAVNGVTQNYGEAIKATQDDRSLNEKEQLEAVSRYGLDPAVLKGMSNERTQAVDKLIGEKATNIDQAQSNTTADLQLNTARASAQESDGIERRGDLRRDLDQILGNLDNSRAGVQNSIAQAKLQGQQADMAAFDRSQQVDSETLASYMQNQRENRKLADERAFKEKELALKQKQAGTGSAGDVAASRLREMNIDPAPIEQAYYSAVSSNEYTSLSGKDKKAWIMNEMLKRINKADPETQMAVGRYVDIKEGYGTDKANDVIPQ
jgi:hypothetical protein